MSGEYILVCVAWPYANADIHQGNVTGSYLPADIYARYHRLQGNHVLMVSGSDSHGTPVTVKADELGQTPRQVFEYYHARFLQTFQQLGLSYDLFTHTDTENHHRVSQDIFRKLLQEEFLFRQVTPQMYSPTTGKFLPDRYIEGTCPVCGYPRARGDQCDNCNTLFESAAQLIQPRSKQDDSWLELRDTEHFFLDLPALAQQGLDAWLNDEHKDHWRPQVINFARNFIREGLIPRAVTRDMDWGIPVPVDLPGYENKVLYVWFEAVIGYLSAAIEWAHNQGTPDAWRLWWQNPQARTVYFIGKDNIPFHTIFWPAELLGVRDLYSNDSQTPLNLPYDVPANEFMNMEGRKISGSMNWGVWMIDALTRHDPDPLRYYLTVIMPETRDSDWSWEGYVERNNGELVANWGNLVNRVLNMIQRYFQGVVPEPGPLAPEDEDLLAAIGTGFDSIAALYDGCKFRAAAAEALRLSTLVNRYLEQTSPWLHIKQTPAAAGHALYVALQAISGLKTLLAPILPFTCQQLHWLLGEAGAIFGQPKVETYHETGRSHAALTYDPAGAVGSWAWGAIPAGRRLPPPQPLFKKLDATLATDELNRLGRPPI